MTRRPNGAQVVGAALFVAVLLLALAIAEARRTPFSRLADRPNIVFVLTDDMSMNLLEHMPEVRRMQSEGTTFSKYYVVDSLCCPSRSAIFTGQYPHNNGVFTNEGPDGGYTAYQANHDARKSFALALDRNGYRTGFIGKYLNGWGITDPIPPGWDDWHASGNAYVGYHYRIDDNGRIRHYGDRPHDFVNRQLDKRAQRFIRDSHGPFFLEVASFTPHAPYTPDPEDLGFARDVPYPRTPAYDTLPSDPPSWLRTRPPLSRHYQVQMEHGFERRIAAMQSIDRLIGTIRESLERKGISDRTYIVFSSDNGFHMGEYRLLAGKQTAFDTDIHVPLVVVGPGVPDGRVDDHLLSSVDLAPTFEALTGSVRPGDGAASDGVDLSRLWHGHEPLRWRQGVLIEHHGPNASDTDPDAQYPSQGDPASYEAVRTATALYVEYDNGEREYYDTSRDPFELVNLARAYVPPVLPRMTHALSTCSGGADCRRAAGG